MTSNALKAKTHPAEYLIHKYWARKPHNILQLYIKRFFNKNDFVVDPFCGSGVFLAEARKQDIKALGFDINPLAYLLADVTTHPPSLKEFEEDALSLVNYIKKKYSHLYVIQNNHNIRYLVHEINSKCERCGTIGSITKSKKDNAKTSKYYCTQCGEKLSFNFEKLHETIISKIYDTNNVEYTDPNLLHAQKNLSDKFTPKGNFNKALIINRRILAFPQMKHSDLFTPRAYGILSDLFNEAHKIKKAKVRRSILLLLTSCVAQCSRLIPYRNNLTTGGPAWTVPGFCRYKKFLKGLKSLNNAYLNHPNKIKVKNISAQFGLQKLTDKSVDGIFFDPPYGDNVPYVEFSDIWNAFLKKKTDYTNEIVVSDRKEFISSWDKYEKDLKSIVDLFEKKLKNHGKIIMTFNNLDPRAWKIVLSSFARSSFYCVEAKYQIPAVVSSKAQMASNTSYIGDYYCVFEKISKKRNINTNIFALTEKIKKVLLSRQGTAPLNLIHRMAILSILNDQMDISLIDKIHDAIIPIAVKEGDHYRLRDELVGHALFERYDIVNLIKTIAISELKNGKKTIQEFYERVLEQTDDLGAPPLSDVKFILSGSVHFDGEFCYLQELNHLSQLPLFSQ
jgi:16S rRNA G966 N2-methylase RsmD